MLSLPREGRGGLLFVLHTDLREDAHGGEVFLHGFLEAEVVEVAGTVVDEAVDGAHFQGRTSRASAMGHGDGAAARGAERVSLFSTLLSSILLLLSSTDIPLYLLTHAARHLLGTGEGVGELGGSVFVNVDVGAPHLVLPVRLWGGCGRGHYLQLDEEGTGDGVGAEDDVLGADVVVAVVAEVVGETCAFGIEAGGTEGVTPAHFGSPEGGVDDGVGRARESEVSHGVDVEEGTRLYVIGDFGLAGILLGDFLVGGLGSEIAVVAQGVAGNLCTDARIDGGEIDGRGGKGVEHPFAKTVLAVNVAVVGPETNGQRLAIVGGAHQGVVGFVGQHAFHFALGCGVSLAVFFGVSSEE